MTQSVSPNHPVELTAHSAGFLAVPLSGSNGENPESDGLLLVHGDSPPVRSVHTRVSRAGLTAGAGPYRNSSALTS
jgi:hypothetical protein